MPGYKIQKFPKSRIATIDVYGVGLRKHHIATMIEVDVTAAREKIKRYRKLSGPVSFTAWLVKVISLSVKENGEVAAYRKGKRKRILFSDINISMMVEKETDGSRVPLPMIIEKADTLPLVSITRLIRNATEDELKKNEIVLQKKSGFSEKIYYHFPSCVRRAIWHFLLNHPHLVYPKMGNVAITSIGMIGNVNGWFLPVSIHPVCFGIGPVLKKPVVVNDEIVIREMLNMTILMDHDVIDGAPMARFIRDLSGNIEKAVGLET